jgi:hypothetical protein
MLLRAVLPGRSGDALVFVLYGGFDLLDRWMRVLDEKNPQKAIAWASAPAALVFYVPKVAVRS